MNDRCVGVILVLLGTPLMAAPPEPPAVLVEAIRTSREADTFAAFAKLEASDDDPETIAKLYGQSVFVIYGEKDVPRMVAFGRAGIRYCLARAAAVGTDEETATKLRGYAKMIAYNVGANCWPGWNDEGVEFTASDLAAGLDAARFNLRMANELDRPADKRAAAEWLLGAQLLAAGEADDARAAFERGAKLNGEAEMPRERTMALGYAALADLTVPNRREAAATAFDAAVKALRDEGSDDAKFYADQLVTARGVFVKE